MMRVSYAPIVMWPKPNEIFPNPKQIHWAEYFFVLSNTPSKKSPVWNMLSWYRLFLAAEAGELDPQDEVCDG